MFQQCSPSSRSCGGGEFVYGIVLSAWWDMGSQAIKSNVSDSAVYLGQPMPKRQRAAPTSKTFLVLAFLLSFSFACAVVMLLGTFLKASGSSAVVIGELSRSQDESFPESVPVLASGAVVRVSDDERLNPAGEGMFLLTAWIKLRGPLVDGDRAAIISKFDPNTLSKPGYAVALVGGPDGVRPQVYWQDENGKGKWLSFAATQMQPKEWYLLALSFRDARYLGLHIRPLNEAGRVEVLGGYDLDGYTIPRPKADLLVGAFGSSKFRGRVGPIGVFSGKDMFSDIPKLLKTMAAKPEQVPHQVDPDEVALWASPKSDSGPKQLSIVVPRNGRPGR